VVPILWQNCVHLTQLVVWSLVVTLAVHLVFITQTLCSHLVVLFSVLLRLRCHRPSLLTQHEGAEKPDGPQSTQVPRVPE
jgi:hypothetical protein